MAPVSSLSVPLRRTAWLGTLDQGGHFLDRFPFPFLRDANTLSRLRASWASGEDHLRRRNRLDKRRSSGPVSSSHCARLGRRASRRPTHCFSFQNLHLGQMERQARQQEIPLLSTRFE